MYMTLVCSMWVGGCGPVIVFGLYSRFGTTKGAWTSLVTGMSMAIIGLIVQRNWANMVYPWLSSNGWDKTAGKILETLSGPFEPIVVWRMNAVKCPINSYEWYFITMVTTLILYCVVSFLTCKEPFNLTGCSIAANMPSTASAPSPAYGHGEMSTTNLSA